MPLCLAQKHFFLFPFRQKHMRLKSFLLQQIEKWALFGRVKWGRALKKAFRWKNGLIKPVKFVNFPLMKMLRSIHDKNSTKWAQLKYHLVHFLPIHWYPLQLCHLSLCRGNFWRHNDTQIYHHGACQSDSRN